MNHSELYDIEADPGETHNVASANPEVVKRMQAKFDQWWETAKPLMVNENMPRLDPANQPFAIRYKKQLKEKGIPDWKPAENFEFKKGQ